MIKKSFNYLYCNEMIRNLILENPGLPLIFFASDDVNDGEYQYMTATNVHASVMDILVENKYAKDCVLFDTDELEEKIADALYDEEPFNHMDTKEFQKAVSEIAGLYKHDWIKVIAVFVE